MIRTLIADDHAIVREGLALLLASIKEVELVGQTGDGNEAVRLARELNPDLVILDNSMPGISGIQAAEAILKLTPPPRVLILTMHSQSNLAAQALQMGAQGFLIKEDAFDELSQAIATVMEGGRFVSPALAVKMVRGMGGGQQRALTSRELEVLKQIALGLSNKQIAEKLCISVKTVDTHRTRIMNKLDLHSTAQLVRYAVKIGLIEP